MGNCAAKKRAMAAAMANRRMGQAAAGTSADMLGNGLAGAGPDQTGAYSSGYGNAIYAMQCPEGIDQDIALLATAAALAVGIYVVYRQVHLPNLIFYVKLIGQNFVETGDAILLHLETSHVVVFLIFVSFNLYAKYLNI